MSSCMESYSARVSTITFHSCIAVLVSTLFAHVSYHFTHPHPTARVEYSEPLSLSYQRVIKGDRLFFNFDLKADLTPLSTWETKLCFAHLVAKFSTKDNPRNEVVVWDSIINTNKDYSLTYSGPNEYPLSDRFKNLRDTDVTLELHVDKVPVTGIHTFFNTGSSQFTVPSEYQNRF